MVGFVAAYAVAALAWLPLRRVVWPLRRVLVIAFVLRAIFLFAEPRLSGDVWRYLFDGRTLAHGTNPYTVLPDDPRVNHPEIPTIYPPHAELLFTLAHQLTLWRLLLIACDLIAIALVRERALALATFPPLLFEGAWSGHVEVVAALLLLVAWQRRSGAAFAAAVGMKVIPIAALPAMWGRGRSGRFAVAFLLVLIVPILPFVMSGPLMPGMRDYATRWVFNSPAYDALFFAVDRSGLAPQLKDIFTSIKDPLHLEPIAHAVYFHLYPDFLTRALLGLIALGLIGRWRRDPVASIGALLLCSPAIHPWYWLVLVPLGLDSGWIWLALCAPASYVLYAGAPPLGVYALCYGLPAIARLRPSATASSVAE